MHMKKIIPLIFIVTLTGCASVTSFKSLPKSEDEFLLEKTKLVEKYPEISVYEKKWRGFSPQYPSEQALKSEFGEPNVVKRDWLYPITMVGTLAILSADPVVWFMVFAVRPDTPKTYFYKKGNYCIKALIDRTFLGFYSEYMNSWEWEEKAESCE